MCLKKQKTLALKGRQNGTLSMHATSYQRDLQLSSVAGRDSFCLLFFTLLYVHRSHTHNRGWVSGWGKGGKAEGGRGGRGRYP